MSLTVKNLSWSYGASQVLKGIELEMPDKGIVEIIGQNGSGKTTLLKILSTVLLPSSNCVFFDSKDILQQVEKVRRTASYSPAVDCSFLPYLTGFENLRYFNELQCKNPDFDSRLGTLVEKYELQHLLCHSYEDMSSGIRQLVSLLRTLLSQAKLKFFDEPYRSLSPKYIELFQQEVKNTSGLVVLSNHTESKLQGSQVYEMQSGSLSHVSTY